MKKIALSLLCGLLFAACGSDDPAPAPTQEPDPDPGQPFEPAVPAGFMKGTTMCFASYLEDHGLVYREAGAAADPYRSVKNHGGNTVRLQLNIEPFAAMEGQTIDWASLERVKADARRAADAGLEIFLTLKLDRDIYGATTTVNVVPTVWYSIRNDVEALAAAIGGEVASALKALGVKPRAVAIGNEVNLDFMGVEGAAWSVKRIAELLEAGFKAVKTYDPQILTALHIASPHNVDRVLPAMMQAGAERFDLIAVSWYEGMEGHSMGSYASFAAMARDFRKKYGRALMILETACSFTNGWGDNCDNAYYRPAWNADANLYSPAKQRACLREMAEDLKSGGGVGLLTWGTESLPSDEVWTYPAAWAHGSTWENNSYWNFADGNNLHEGIDWMSDIE